MESRFERKYNIRFLKHKVWLKFSELQKLLDRLKELKTIKNTVPSNHDLDKHVLITYSPLYMQEYENYTIEQSKQVKVLEHSNDGRNLSTRQSVTIGQKKSFGQFLADVKRLPCLLKKCHEFKQLQQLLHYTSEQLTLLYRQEAILQNEYYTLRKQLKDLQKRYRKELRLKQ